MVYGNRQRYRGHLVIRKLIEKRINVNLFLYTKDQNKEKRQGMAYLGIKCLESLFDGQCTKPLIRASEVGTSQQLMILFN